jgi:hypothetical protein
MREASLGNAPAMPITITYTNTSNLNRNLRHKGLRKRVTHNNRKA